MAAKEYAAHSSPGPMSDLSKPLDSNANMKMISTRMPNISMELMDSLLLISMTMSLKTIAASGFNEDFGAGGTTKNVGLGFEAGGRLLVELDRARAGEHGVAEKPFGVSTKDGPEVVLHEVALRDERSTGMSARGRKTRGELGRKLGREVAAPGEESNEAFIGDFGARGDEITVLEKDTPNAI